MKRSTGVAVIAAVLTLLVMPGTAAGEPDADSDLAMVAAARGWTIEQARADREVADRMGRVQEAVAKRWPDAFIGGVLSATPGGTPTLLLKGKADKALLSIVADAGTPIRVQDGQPFSFTELEKRSMQVHDHLAALGYRDIGTAVDIRSAQVLATVSAQAGLPASAAALSARLPGELTTALDLTVTDEPVGTDLRAMGGMAVQKDGVFQCTSGWPVVHTSTGVRGVTTAGHCDVNELVDPRGSLPDVAQQFPFQAEHRGEWGDVEWHTSPDATPANHFFEADNQIRPVNSVEARANITVGEAVCVYGRSSNSRDCGMSVFLTSAACTVDGDPNDRLVAMNKIQTLIGGDSGGPWFVDFRAYGSTKGICGFSGAARAVWSVADLYDEALGVTVNTAP